MSLSLVNTGEMASAREKIIQLERAAERFQENANDLRGELECAHNLLDCYVNRALPYKHFGNRIASVPERIEAALRASEKYVSDLRDKVDKQYRANEQLVADVKALREAMDFQDRTVEAERRRWAQNDQATANWIQYYRAALKASEEHCERLIRENRSKRKTRK